MNTRRVIIIFVTFALLISATALWNVSGDERDGDTAANVVATSGAESGSDADAPKKKGGGLFGKGDDGKLARMTEKDGERFESVGVVRVEDRDNKRPSMPDEGGDARDYL